MSLIILILTAYDYLQSILFILKIHGKYVFHKRIIVVYVLMSKFSLKGINLFC